MDEKKHKAVHRKKKRRMGVGKMIVLDLLAIAAGLLLFALFHHVLPHYGILRVDEGEPVVLTTLAPQPTPVPAPTETPEETPPEETPPEETPEPVRVYSGRWGEKFADKFTDGEDTQTENRHQIANINVSDERSEEHGVL